MAAYCGSRHDTIGYSPNQLVLGRETRAPIDIIYGTEEMPVEQETYTDFI